jgi:glycosyltransferase involved in cell wall biosynthesis
MRILFDAYWWATGPVSNRQVLRQIICSWLQQFPQDEVVLAVKHGDLAATSAEVPSSVTLIATRLKPQGISAIVELPFLAKRTGADVIVTHNFTPLFGRSGVFIHDFLFVTNPEWFTRKERAYFRLMPLSARLSNVVFSSTRNEAKRIARVIGTRKKVAATGLALNPALIEAAPERPGMLPPMGSYILTVGRLNVRKNLEFTATAAARSRSITREHPLVIAGAFHGKSTTFSHEVTEAIAAGRIVLSGHVTDAELSWLYQHAAAFVFMSLDEGFGLPPLEALYFERTVIASDIAVMREVLGPFGLYVDPTDVVAMSNAIDSLDPRGISANIGRSRKYVTESYSWAATVTTMRTELLQLEGQ